MTRIAATALLALAACAPASSDAPLAGPGSDSPSEQVSRPDAPPQAEPPSAPARYVVVSSPRIPDPDLAYVAGGHQPGQGDPVPASVRAAFDRSRGVGAIPDLPLVGGGGNSSYVGTNQIQVSGTPIPNAPGWYSMTLTNTGTGWVERMVLRVPNSTTPASTPVLVVFHKFGASEWDFYYNTTFYAEANARDWLLVAPYSASTKHFGCEPAQVNTKHVLDFVMQYFPQADPNRVYGVGFSMGGSTMLSYAARELDPAHARFAAVASHTGGGALWHTYGNEPDDDDADDSYETGQHLEVPDILDFWYGGSPTAVPFAYQTHTVLDMDAVGNLGLDTHMLTNLVHVPIRFYMAQNDPIGYIRDQHQAVYNTFGGLGGQGDFATVPGTVHSWSTLDETEVCDWLATHSLQLPDLATTLAHKDGRFFFFDVRRSSPTGFGKLVWSRTVALNQLVFLDVRNVAEVTIDIADAGLAPTADLQVISSAADGGVVAIRLQGMPYQPNQVRRDGQPSASWIYDSGSQTLTITDFDPSVNTWVVDF